MIGGELDRGKKLFLAVVDMEGQEVNLFSHLQPLFLLSDPYFNKVTPVKRGLLSYSLPQPSTSWQIKDDSCLGGYLRS